jgi:hypothetical protein
VAVLDDYRRRELVREGRREVLTARYRQDKGHQAGWEKFLTAVRGGQQPPIPYEHLFGGTKAAFAAVKSLHSGQVEEIH